MKKKIILTILDGWGLRAPVADNAVFQAHPATYNALWGKWPHTQLACSGLAVGLPEGQMGNSEVGHLNIGAGRRVFQELTRISEAISDDSFFANDVLNKAIDNALSKDGNLHLFGLVSDGGVHSHIKHLFGMLELAKRRNFKKVYIHCFLDGRDTPPKSADLYIAQLEEYCRENDIGHIATLSGRYLAMDRDNHWERIKKAYDLIVRPSAALRTGLSPLEAVQASYQMGKSDEFVEPIAMQDYPGVKNGDSVVFFNFRPDRARQLTRCFLLPASVDFDVEDDWSDIYFATFTKYSGEFEKAHVAFPESQIDNSFGEIVSKAGLKQVRIAETEKYAHVTFFFNGGRETVFAGEDRILVPSPRVATYDLKPEMSAIEVADKTIERILDEETDVIIVNFANADMVGHTGFLAAAETAVKTVDACLGRIYQAVLEKDAVWLITADHGNAEQMFDETTGQPYSAHTTNPVPFIIVNYGETTKIRDCGKLCDIAPTALDIMGIGKPVEMKGESLIVR